MLARKIQMCKNRSRRPFPANGPLIINRSKLAAPNLKDRSRTDTFVLGFQDIPLKATKARFFRTDRRSVLIVVVGDYSLFCTQQPLFAGGRDVSAKCCDLVSMRIEVVNKVAVVRGAQT